MADPIDLVITSAGLDALVDAENGDTDPIVITQVGLSDAGFDPAPTLTALPGEFKRLAAIAGQSVAPNQIHMTAQDLDAVTYDVRGLGLFLADGTLFATFAQAEPIFSKVEIAIFLFAFDVRFTGNVADSIAFGDAIFLYPPATETIQGVAEIARQEEVDAEEDDERIVTPKKLGVRLAGLKATIDAALAALTAYVNDEVAGLTQFVNDALATFAARRVTGDGLATGGGDLTEDRVITVTRASGTEVAAGTSDDVAVTPLALAQVPQTFGAQLSVLGLGGAVIKTGTLSVSWPGGGSHTFPVAFPNACDRVLITPLGNPNGGDESDEPWWVSAISRTGFSVSCAGDGSTVSFAYLAIGH